MSTSHIIPKGGFGTTGLLLLLPPPLFWAGNFIVGRAMHEAVPPFALSMWRWIIAFLLLLPFAAPAMRRDLPRYWQHRWTILGVSLSGVFSFNTLIYLGLRTTTAANALLLNSFIPILVVLFGALFFGQVIRRVQVAGLLISLLGVLTIVLQGDWYRLASFSFAKGDLIIFCAMISWAFYTLWLRKIPAGIDRIGLMGTQMALALLVLVPCSLWEHSTGAAVQWSAQVAGALAYLGIFPSVVAYLLYNFAVARLGAAQAGLSIHLIPVFGVLLAVLFLGEQVHPYHVLGIAAIACGLGCASPPCWPRP
ncbi:DMT family transporter [uncultured Paracoccus sp.]|uniref:DMT family transporter n=1 Tax=uncultured Paracoccus sp. TaxID=189685 RepID=UPI0026184778|nr:DMT family transporter [uncultured Paracoccus sp.]HMR36797.1 DMT family transporter [Paracoccus sp. (in: a-proteobacteria)]